MWKSIKFIIVKRERERERQEQHGLIYANRGRLFEEGGKDLTKHRLPASWLHLLGL